MKIVFSTISQATLLPRCVCLGFHPDIDHGLQNGEGPTILFTDANHGDEYGGPGALFDLADKINAEEISGRVIIVPGKPRPLMAGT